MASFSTTRDAILTQITKLFSARFSKADNLKLHTPPSGDEIDKTILGFPKGKSSGGDGVTYDFLQGYWSFVGVSAKI